MDFNKICFVWIWGSLDPEQDPGFLCSSMLEVGVCKEYQTEFQTETLCFLINVTHLRALLGHVTCLELIISIPVFLYLKVHNNSRN